MNTHSTILDNASVEATTLNRILQAALAGQGNIREAVDQFNDHPGSRHESFSPLRRDHVLPMGGLRLEAFQNVPRELRNTKVHVWMTLLLSPTYDSVVLRSLCGDERFSLTALLRPTGGSGECFS